MLFSYSGLPRHLAQSRDPRCVAHRNSLYSYHDDVDMSEVPLHPSRDHHPHGDSDNIFKGDLFGGDYTTGDFPGWDDKDREDVDQEDVDQEDMDLRQQDLHANPIQDDIGQDWEPPIIQSQSSSDNVNLAEQEDDSGLAASAPAPFQHGCKQALREPACRVRYGREAGAPVSNTESHEYERYKAELGDENESIYAPFHSKTDWEFAKWAKLHGPSSSSLNELLKIENVGCLFHHVS